jgi:hypothetical protein
MCNLHCAATSHTAMFSLYLSLPAASQQPLDFAMRNCFHAERIALARTVAFDSALLEWQHLLPACPARLQDVLNEVERNLHDAMGVARNVALDPRLVPGGGAVEMAIARGLNDKASTVYLLSPLLITEISHGLVTLPTMSGMHHNTADVHFWILLHQWL